MNDKEAKQIVVHYVSKLMENLQANFNKIADKHGTSIGSAVILSVGFNMEHIKNNVENALNKEGVRPEDIEYFETRNKT